MDFQVITTEDDEFIVGFVNGSLKHVRSDHPNYQMVKNLLSLTPEELEDEGEANIAALFDPAEAISKRFEELTERVSVRAGTIYFDGDPLNNALADLIVKLMEQDEDFYPFVLFLENLMQNPEEHSRKMAFEWIQAAGDGMSITDHGYVVGFKGTESDGNGGYQSTTAGHAIVDGVEHNGKIPYAVGNEVTMPRSEVTFDPNNSCSSGLHIGTRSYARQFMRGGAMLECWINPRDIVSVPRGEHAKMRVSRFYIADTVEDDTVIGALRKRSDVGVYVSPTESPYDEDEYGDGEEFEEDFESDEDALDTDEEFPEDYGADDEDDEDESDSYEDDEPSAFVGRSVRNPDASEFAEMAARAKRRHRGSPGSAAFRTYASTVGGWSLVGGQDGSDPSHWTLSA